MPTAESLTTETETPTESQPVNIEMPTESLPTDSQPVQMEMPTESLTSDTETPAESQPVNIEMPTESLPSDTESPTEGQPADIELSVENVPDEILVRLSLLTAKFMKICWILTRQFHIRGYLFLMYLRSFIFERAGAGQGTKRITKTVMFHP